MKNLSSLLLILVLGLTLSVTGCKPEREIIMTVNGPLDPEKLGTTLPHEHILVDFIGADSTGYYRWNRDSVIAKVLPYLIEAKKAGVVSMMECTPAFLGRDPVLLQRLSTLSGINLITNTGYYGAIENKALPKETFSLSVDQLADVWINEWLKGIDSTQIRPGFIKIAVPGDSLLSPVHEKLVRAAARAHLKTGLVINAHTGPSAPALAEVEILQQEGVDPSAFIWTHAQAGSSDIHTKLARAGCWISLDNVMVDNLDNYVSMILAMKEAGLLNKVLISHDAGWYDVINPEGNIYRGYTALFTHLRQALIAKGFTSNDWNLLTVVNPKEAYTIKVRRL